MNKSCALFSALIGLAFPLTSLGSYAPLLVNGSFEIGPDTGGGFVTLFPGDISIQNWEVVGENSVDYIGSFWEASDGNRSIDLSGTDAGAIEQTFNTVRNEMYRVTFDIAGNPGSDSASPSTRELRASIDTGSHSLFEEFTFDTTGQSLKDMGWLTQEFVFTAKDSTSTLRFSSLTEGGYGPALDNVQVSVVPVAPAAFFMLSGLLSFVGFKKSQVSKHQ
jgi:choice-of-anchor C domain-containing protein